MAESLQVQHSSSGATLYAIIRNTAGAVWNGSSFVTYATADLGNYDLPMTEQGTASRFYAVATPALSAGRYSAVAFVQGGGSPAETDAPIRSGDFEWSGTAFVGQTGDAYAIVNSGTHGNAALKTLIDALTTTIGAAGAGLTATATAVWSVATRILTAGTNIVLAKGTGVTGFNDLDASGVRTAVGLASANLDTQLDALPTNAELATALAAADDAILAAISTAQTAINAIKTVTDLLTAAQSEPTGVPAANDTPLTKIARLHQVLRNGLTVTSSAKNFNDDGGSPLWKKALSDNGTTYTEGEAAAP